LESHVNKKYSPVIVALDSDADEKSVMDFINRLDPDLCELKIGKYLFTKWGPDFVRTLVKKQFHIFLDLKFHDIPNTVFHACVAAAELGVWMLNVHISGGVEMMRAARKAIDQFPAKKKPLLIGVTVLTSLNEADLLFLGMHDSIEDTVLRMAKKAKECGLDGVVCSAKEAILLRKELGKDFLLVTPGIRLINDAVDDQKRIMTPEAALANGVDYLVMGRSIADAKNPRAILAAIKKHGIDTN